MKVQCLIENTNQHDDLIAEHGLSLYIETKECKILMDTGATGKFLDNAVKLGVDISSVDLCFLSHGHYDHGGGLKAFMDANSKAPIYVSPKAFGQYYHQKGEKNHYIGLEEFENRDRFVYTDSNTQFPAGISYFTNVTERQLWPSTNRELKEKIDNGYVQDEFQHEQYLVIEEDNKRILISGCAHNGIINILSKFHSIYNCYPDYVFSGFHMLSKNGYSNEAVTDIISTGNELNRYGTKFYTCHCTGEEPFIYLKKIMGDHIEYISTGDEVII